MRERGVRDRGCGRDQEQGEREDPGGGDPIHGLRSLTGSGKLNVAVHYSGLSIAPEVQ